MSTNRRKDLGLGPTAAGGNDGSYAAQLRPIPELPGELIGKGADAALAEAGISRPENWEELGLHAQAAWEEEQLEVLKDRLAASEHPMRDNSGTVWPGSLQMVQGLAAKDRLADLPKDHLIAWEDPHGLYDAQDSGLYSHIYFMSLEEETGAFYLSLVDPAPKEGSDVSIPLTNRQARRLFESDEYLAHAVDDEEIPRPMKLPLEEAVPDEEARSQYERSFVAAGLWTGEDDDGEPLDTHYDYEDLHPDTLQRLQGELSEFVSDNRAMVDEFLQKPYPTDNRNILAERMGRLGHDFMLTRNREGTGFWDRTEFSKELGEKLTDAAHEFPEVNFFVGDDGKVHNE